MSDQRENVRFLCFAPLREVSDRLPPGSPPAHVYASRVETDGTVLVCPQPRVAAADAKALPLPPKADADWIGEQLVERGLVRKFGPTEPGPEEPSSGR